MSSPLYVHSPGVTAERVRRTLVTTLAAFLLASIANAADTDPTLKCSGTRCDITIDWQTAQKGGHFRVTDALIAERKADRITRETVVAINVTHFNFLNYGLDVQVEDKPVESYIFLEKLFRQVVGRGGVGGPGQREDRPFDRALIAWRMQIRKADEVTDDLRRKYPNVALSEKESESVKADKERQETNRKDLDVKAAEASDALQQFGTGEDLDRYEATLRAHEQVRAKVQAFIDAAGLSVDGFHKSIAAKPSGHIVTVTLTPTQSGSASAMSPFVVEYFVHSTLPLNYHVGISYANLRSVKFDQVRTAGGADLFSAVKSGDKAEDLAAMMSYQRASACICPLGWGLTLGTGVKDPGEKLMMGLSLNYKRFYVTFGGASSTLTEGRGKVIDKIVDAAGNVVGSRDLFQTIERHRKWGGFVAISFNPF
jgi:hypothetical protein